MLSSVLRLAKGTKRTHEDTMETVPTRYQRRRSLSGNRYHTASKDHHKDLKSTGSPRSRKFIWWRNIDTVAYCFSDVLSRHFVITFKSFIFYSGDVSLSETACLIVSWQELFSGIWLQCFCPCFQLGPLITSTLADNLISYMLIHYIIYLFYYIQYFISSCT